MDNVAMDVQIAVALAKLFEHLRSKLITINTHGYGPGAQTHVSVFPRAIREIAPVSHWTITETEKFWPDGSKKYYKYDAKINIDGILFTAMLDDDDLLEELKPVPVEMPIAMAEAVLA